MVEKTQQQTRVKAGRLAVNDLYGGMRQKTGMFITTALANSDPE
jgi:hypothetical protein